MASRYRNFVQLCLALSLLLNSVNGKESSMHTDTPKTNVDQTDISDAVSARQQDSNNLSNSIDDNNIEEDISEKELNYNLGLYNQYRLVKRTPNGFMGMRGKKDYFADGNFENSNIQWNHHLLPAEDDESNYIDENDDRFGLSNGARLKKAPTAFYGKKFSSSSNEANGYSRLERFLENLEDERMRENIFENIMQQISGVGGEMTKRAPTGFTGMRGKRLMSEEEMAKRAPPNAFTGVRGKKDIRHQSFKRSPNSPRLLDLGNKFVAVRGKKNSALGITDYLINTSGYIPQLSYQMGGGLENDDWPTEKRTPKGFLALRGKR